ncbi:hypothetical protein [Acinetobacter pullicarnis]|uniref:hypothetical protein n=1 Tax=Acinetobacter pullicarnis TaxID=2576829 RepID=UPI0011232D65|nr:hypothetical protein [Acinetobacter pullicarnis]
MNTVFILWQDKSHSGRMWHAVAKIIYDLSSGYILSYTKGASNSRFHGFPNMVDKTQSYSSRELFSFLKNRIPPSSRPEHEALYEWCNLETSANYLELLAASGGEKATDSYRVISLPQNENGSYLNTFFVSGIRYLDESQKLYISSLKAGHLIDYVFEDNNINDPLAVLLLDHVQKTNLGYYPRYLTDDLRNLNDLKANVQIQVVKVNQDAPEQFRMLCKTTSSWPTDFKSCDNDEFRDYID